MPPRDVTRAVALGAVRRGVHQIGAAVPRRRLRGVGTEGLFVEEQKLPPADEAADVERERHLMGGGTALRGRQRAQISEEIARVVEAHMRVSGVGKGWVIMLPAGRGALGHGGDELGLGPAADAVIGIGRDVGRIERPERRFQRLATAETGAVLLVLRGVAGGAAARREQLTAIVEIGGARRQRAGLDGAGDGQHPESRKADNGRGHRRQDKLAQHRRTFRSLAIIRTA